MTKPASRSLAFWGVASEAHCSDWVSRRKGGDDPTATGYTLGFSVIQGRPEYHPVDLS